MQKFKNGDYVRVVKDLGRCMSHFTADCDAIVIHSYKDKYGGNDRQANEYCIHIKGQGETSWYSEEQLTLIEKNRIDLLKIWKKEEKEEKRLHSDLDWIFANGKSVLHSASGATIKTLADCVGVGNLWGPHGEGFVYYQNAMAILHLAKPFLESNDKAGWIAFAENERTSCAKEAGLENKESQAADA